jgi:2,3-diketo-5-methylthio-1-phosphopentane phosphatase
MNTQKQLLVYDFDNTIVEGFSDFHAIDLMKDKLLKEEILLKYGKLSWLEVMQEIFVELKKQNINSELVKDAVINCKMNEGFKELFEYVNLNYHLYDSMIVSGGNSLFIRWILEKYNHKMKFFALPSQIQDDSSFKIDKMHSHDCPLCPLEMCKKKVISDYLEGNKKSYRNIVFIGDGYNDYCTSIWLKEHDYILPREKFVLHKLILDAPSKVICKVNPWRAGQDILRLLQKIR